MLYKLNMISCQSYVGLIPTLYIHTNLANPIINPVTAQMMWPTVLIIHTYHNMKTVDNLRHVWEEVREALYETKQHMNL